MFLFISKSKFRPISIHFDQLFWFKIVFSHTFSKSNGLETESRFLRQQLDRVEFSNPHQNKNGAQNCMVVLDFCAVSIWQVFWCHGNWQRLWIGNYYWSLFPCILYRTTNKPKVNSILNTTGWNKFCSKCIVIHKLDISKFFVSICVTQDERGSIHMCMQSTN